MALAFLFGKSAPAPAPAESAPTDLRKIVETLNAHLLDLEKSQNMWRDREVAALEKMIQCYAEGDKKAAVLWCRRKQVSQSTVSKALSLAEAVEEQVLALRCKATKTDDLKAIDTGLETVKRMRDRIKEVVEQKGKEPMTGGGSSGTQPEVGPKDAGALLRPAYDKEKLAAEVEALCAKAGSIGATATATATAAPAPAPVPAPALPKVPTGDAHTPGIAATAEPATVSNVVGGASGGGGSDDGGLSALEALDVAI